MSFEKNYGNHYPFDNEYGEDEIVNEDDILQDKIDEYLAEEQAINEEIQRVYKEVVSDEK